MDTKRWYKVKIVMCIGEIMKQWLKLSQLSLSIFIGFNNIT